MLSAIVSISSPSLRPFRGKQTHQRSYHRAYRGTPVGDFWNEGIRPMTCPLLSERSVDDELSPACACRHRRSHLPVED